MKEHDHNTAETRRNHRWGRLGRRRLPGLLLFAAVGLGLFAGGAQAEITAFTYTKVNVDSYPYTHSSLDVDCRVTQYTLPVTGVQGTKLVKAAICAAVAVPSDSAVVCSIEKATWARAGTFTIEYSDKDPSSTASWNSLVSMTVKTSESPGSLRVPKYDSDPKGKTYWVRVSYYPNSYVMDGRYTANFNLVFTRADGGSSGDGGSGGGGGGGGGGSGGTHTTENLSFGVTGGRAEVCSYDVDTVASGAKVDLSSSSWPSSGWAKPVSSMNGSVQTWYIVVAANTDMENRSGKVVVAFQNGDTKTYVVAQPGTFVVVTDPAADADGRLIQEVPAAGGIAKITLKNRSSSSVWMNCQYNVNTAFAPSYNYSTGESGSWWQSKTIDANSSANFYWKVPRNTTGQSRSQTISFFTGNYSIEYFVSIRQAAEGSAVEKPTAPTVKVETFGDRANADSITVTWSGGSGATSYNLYRSTSDSRPSSAYKMGVASPYVDGDSSLAPGVAYYYWVEAKNSAGSAYSGSDWGNRAVALRVGATGVAAPASGGTQTVAVTANTDWEATSDVGWIHFTTGSGSGNGTLQFTVDANTGTSERPGTVTVTAGGGTAYPKSESIAVTQAGAAVVEPTRPANDDFESAATISGASGSVTGNNKGATRQASENDAPSGMVSVWYKWTAPFSGRATFDTDWQGGTVVLVATGTAVDSLTVVAAWWDWIERARSGGQPAVFSAVGGTTYHIGVYESAGDEGGDFELSWSLDAAPTAPTASIPKRGDNADADSIRVTWSGGSGATSYNLYRSTSDSRPSSAYKTGVASPYVDNDSSLAPGVKYYYWVEAKNSAGSAYSGSAWGNRAVTLGLAPETVAAPEKGGESTVAVSANTGWTATTGEEWIHVAAGSGSGDGTLRFSVDANTGSGERKGTVTVTAGSGTAYPKTAPVRITQQSGGFAVGSFETDWENGLIWVRFSGTKGVTYQLQRTQTLGGAWTTARTFTATNDGESVVDAAIPGKWNTGFFRVEREGTDGGDAPGTETNAPGGTYWVVDMSGGASATSWPVSILDEVPAGGWTDEHKTTKLVLRRIEAGTFMMGSPEDELGRYGDETQHEVAISKPFYMGVFEVTHKQWKLAMESNSSGSAYPKTYVSYNDIRGTGVGANWPADGQVDAESFLGVVRAKTGLSFDLPTEAQWEYACRAGTTSALNSGKDLMAENECENMAEVGRYAHNQNDGKDYSTGSAKVGCYLPNAWGLYDMHGNVSEWCLDWYGSYAEEAVTDPEGTSSGWRRAWRGGGWDYDAQYCRSASRGWATPNNDSDHFGFRLACSAGL